MNISNFRIFALSCVFSLVAFFSPSVVVVEAIRVIKTFPLLSSVIFKQQPIRIFLQTIQHFYFVTVLETMIEVWDTGIVFVCLD